MTVNAFVRSVNIGVARSTEFFSDTATTGIDKRPVSGPIQVAAPTSGSGLAGDEISDLRHHGGPEQAVYAYAWEDMLGWAPELERELGPGVFGENLTTEGLDVNGALLGERWQLGSTLVLQVTMPRIPCRTFAAWLGERGWVKRFTERALPGAYLRVVTPGAVQAGDPVRVLHRPTHGVSVGTVFRAITREPELLPLLLEVPELPEATRERARRRTTTARAAQDSGTGT
ncbi:MOSC domain-containing protein [Kitasatospora kifunensis]|uniref:MOSC domain-containing protein YiiM n=1 Tax=Kitasatospora kifunensis TaxID=58351 RepID=A0A7W7R3X4_KITKI|nr:MOSC domain-containing protein [Kitasatospora kifunensis]MBB4924431.1 MOSC domain-containing protein YiiM [Kitasatospora kifunensis]